MSFAEFTYPILQAWDWWHMYSMRRVCMQIGGSDQYGNITAGLDAIKYLRGNHPDRHVKDSVNQLHSVTPFGFTVPLLTTASGNKFGKSAGNAVWLDADKTSPFDLYRYFMRTTDADVEKYLKLLTFMPMDAINDLMARHRMAPHLRQAQHALASDFLELVHGSEISQKTRQQHEQLFHRNSNTTHVTLKEFKFSAADYLQSNPANVRLSHHQVHGQTLARILRDCGIAESVSEGRRLVSQQAIYHARLPQGSPTLDQATPFIWMKCQADVPVEDYIMSDRIMLLRKGKTNVYVVEVRSKE